MLKERKHEIKYRRNIVELKLTVDSCIVEKNHISGEVFR